MLDYTKRESLIVSTKTTPTKRESLTVFDKSSLMLNSTYSATLKSSSAKLNLHQARGGRHRQLQQR